MKIIHEREKCIGCGACVGVCPSHWEIADDGKSMLAGSKKNEETGNYELEVTEPLCNKDAADSCPINIIKIAE
jgi:ferredoxin